MKIWWKVHKNEKYYYKLPYDKSLSWKTFGKIKLESRIIWYYILTQIHIDFTDRILYNNTNKIQSSHYALVKC